MKRILAFVLVLVLSCAVSIPSFAEDDSGVFSYDFDLHFHMNADVFPARIRSHMQGYADLLNILELYGNIISNPAADSIDLSASVSPVTNPDAAISFRLYGIPENMGLSSPLLRDETIWFQNYVLMEFAYKTWNNLRIPLQYVTLLYPYVTESAFEHMVNAWNTRFDNIRKSRSISQKEIKALSQAWSKVLHSDSRLKYWIYSLSLPAEKGSVMETEFFRLPDYVLNQVSYGKGLKVEIKNDSVTWTNEKKEVLFTRTDGENSSEWTLTLPATENGYLPYISWKSETIDDLYSLSLKATYNLYQEEIPETAEETADEPDPENRQDPDDQPDPDDQAEPEEQVEPAVQSSRSSSSLPESLFVISLDMKNWPTVWPMEAEFDADLLISGTILPNAVISIHGTSLADGSFTVVMSQPVNEKTMEMKEVLTVTGTITPVPAASVPEFTLDDFSSCVSIFNVNNQTMEKFVHHIRRPLLLGILNFLNELPARACQSVMDDLENYGVLDLILVD